MCSSTCLELRLLWPIAALFIAPGCLGASAATSEQHTEAPYQAHPDAPERLVVRTDLVERLKSTAASGSEVTARIQGYGRASFAPDAAYDVHVPFVSYVERVFVSAGEQVKAGQPLAQLRSSHLAELRADLSRAQVQVRVQEQQVQRLRPLVADGTATERELSEAEAALQIAEANLRSVRQSLAAVGPTGGAGDRYTLRASSSGSVVRRNIAPGERPAPEGRPAFVIGDPERLVMRAAFPEREARWLEEGAKCFFTAHALSERRFEGKLTHVLRAVNPDNRSVEASCVPNERIPDLTAEMRSLVEVEVNGDERLLVPRRALLMKRDKWVAFVHVDTNVVERREVSPGVLLGDAVQVVAGIAPGEKVIVEGAVLLDGELDVLL